MDGDGDGLNGCGGTICVLIQKVLSSNYWVLGVLIFLLRLQT